MDRTTFSALNLAGVVMALCGATVAQPVCAQSPVPKQNMTQLRPLKAVSR